MVPVGSRGRRRRLALLGAVLAAALSAGPALSRTPEPPNREGGKLRVNVTGTDFNSLDPAVNYDTDGAQLLYATCAKLFTYPDSSKLAGSMLEPELSAGLPTVSADGRTYVFRIAAGFRFSNGAPVGAADVAYTIRRDLDPRMHSPSVPFLRDLIAYGANGDMLTLKLRHPAPDLLARLAMPFFCVVPAGTPIRPTDTIPSAGPYYVAARKRGISVTLDKNPYYSGQRPNHLDEIDFSVFQNGLQSTHQIEAGYADYDLHGVPLELRREIAVRYGVNGTHFFVHPNAQTDWLVLNTSRPLFRDASVRRAVAYAVDRLALLHALGFMAGKVTTQILPPGVPGYRKIRAYPLKADVAAARKLMGDRHGTAVLYISDNPVDAAIADVITRDLARIGIEIDRREFRTADYNVRIHRRSEPFDMTINGWVADYLDPYDFINVALSGRNIPTVDNQNMSHFNNPSFDRRMDAAAALSGNRRYTAYAQLDAQITRDEAPIVPYANEYRVEFVSRRVGCVVIAPGAGGLDLSAACVKR